jgi:hypothetical protein
MPVTSSTRDWIAERLVAFVFFSSLATANAPRDLQCRRGRQPEASLSRPVCEDLLNLNPSLFFGGISSAHHVATLAGLKTRRKNYTTTSGNRKTAPDPFLHP